MPKLARFTPFALMVAILSGTAATTVAAATAPPMTTAAVKACTSCW